jgi:hypothetical protein
LDAPGLVTQPFAPIKAKNWFFKMCFSFSVFEVGFFVAPLRLGLRINAIKREMDDTKAHSELLAAERAADGGGEVLI